MKINSELRKLNVGRVFIKMVGEANLTWEEKVSLRDAVRSIVEKEGVKKIADRKDYVIMDFCEYPLSINVKPGCAGITFNTIMVDRDGVEHSTYRSTPLFEDIIQYNTMKEIMGVGCCNKLKAALRTRYIENRMKGVKGFERKPLNF